MKAFSIEISSISKGPEELKYQLPVRANVLKQIPGKDRPDYFIAELKNSILWIDNEEDTKTEITHLVLASKKKSEVVSPSMKNVLVAIAYVTDDTVLKDKKLDFSKCEYVALGKASAWKKWGLF